LVVLLSRCFVYFGKTHICKKDDWMLRFCSFQWLMFDYYFYFRHAVLIYALAVGLGG
jgi:hypothetical protein